MIDREVRALVASDAFADIWVRVNIRAQQALVRVLEGDESGAVSVQGDQVVRDVSDVIAQVQQRLVARGLTIVENVPIPEVDKHRQQTPVSAIRPKPPGGVRRLRTHRVQARSLGSRA